MQWSVMKEPVPATSDQLDVFRQLLTKDMEPLGGWDLSYRKHIFNQLCFLVDNFRPPQLLGTRDVLDVMTVQMLRKGSHSSSERLAGQGALLASLVLLMWCITGSFDENVC